MKQQTLRSYQLHTNQLTVARTIKAHARVSKHTCSKVNMSEKLLNKITRYFEESNIFLPQQEQPTLLGSEARATNFPLKFTFCIPRFVCIIFLSTVLGYMLGCHTNCLAGLGIYRQELVSRVYFSVALPDSLKTSLYKPQKSSQ